MSRTFFVILGILFLVFSPVLIGGRIFAGGDVTMIAYPHYTFYKQALESGESFLWNPGLLAGFPSFASLASAFFSPINYIAYSFFDISVYQWLMFLNAVLGAFFTALLLKHFGLSRSAQILGGLTYVFSQWGRISDNGISNGVPLLPLIFLLLWLSRKRCGWRWIPLGGLIIGYLVLSTHYNWIPFILVASGLFALYLGLREAKNVGKTYAWNVPVKFMAMAVIGLGIGLIQMVPALLLVVFSSRAGGLDFQEAAAHGIGIFDLIRFYLPYFYPPFLAQASSQLYIGIIPLFLSLIALSRKESLVRFFSGLFLFAFLLSIRFSPLFWILQKFPGFNVLQVPDRWMFIGMFALAVLAAFGFDRLGTSMNRWKLFVARFFMQTGKAVVAGSLIAALVLAAFHNKIVLLLQEYFRVHLYARTSGLPLEHYYQAIERTLASVQGIFDLASLKFLFSLAFLTFGIVWMRQLKKGILPSFVARRTALAIALANFVFIFIFFLPTISQNTFSAEPLTATFLQQKPARYFTFAPGFSEWVLLTVPYGADLEDAYVFKSEMLVPNIGLKYGLASVDAYDSLMPRRMARLLAFIGSDRATSGEKLVEEEIPPEAKIEKFNLRKFLLDILGVRYVVSAFPLDEKVFVKVYETRIPPHDIPVFVYENMGARPEVYAAENVVTIAPDEDEAYRILSGGDIGRGTALIECAQCPDISNIGTGTISVIEEKNGFIRIESLSEKNILLIFSQQLIPNWQATIDGTNTSIYRANSVFQAILVPSGKHEVVFSYHYPGIRQVISLWHGN